MRIKKFDFENFANTSRDFVAEKENKIIPSTKNDKESIILHSFTDEELANLKEKTYKAGIDEGQSRSKQEVEEIKRSYENLLSDKINKENILSSISSNIKDSAEQIENMKSEFINSLGEAALILVENLFSSVTKEVAKERIMSLIKQHGEAFFNKSKVKIIVHEELIDDLKNELFMLINTLDSKTEIKLTGRADMSLSDIKIIWDNGLIKSEQKSVLENLCEKIKQIFEI